MLSFKHLLFLGILVCKVEIIIDSSQVWDFLLLRSQQYQEYGLFSFSVLSYCPIKYEVLLKYWFWKQGWFSRPKNKWLCSFHDCFCNTSTFLPFKCFLNLERNQNENFFQLDFCLALVFCANVMQFFKLLWRSHDFKGGRYPRSFEVKKTVWVSFYHFPTGKPSGTEV